MLPIDTLTLVLYSTAVAGGLLVGSISPSLAYSRSVLLGITLMHSVLAGALIGVFINTVLGIPVPPELTAVVLAIAFSILTAEAVNRGVPEDSSIAATVSVSVSITILVTYVVSLTAPLGVSRAMSYVFGTSSIASFEDLLRVGMALVIVAPLSHIFWNEYKYVSFDPEGAEAMGLSVRFYRYLYFALASVATTALAMTLGVLLTHIVISVPGLIALRKKYVYPYRLTYLLGTIVVVGGYVLARFADIPPSGGVGIVASAIIAYVLVIRRERE